MESDDFTRHYIIRYLSARELVLPPLASPHNVLVIEAGMLKPLSASNINTVVATS